MARASSCGCVCVRWWWWCVCAWWWWWWWWWCVFVVVVKGCGGQDGGRQLQQRMLVHPARREVRAGVVWWTVRAGQNLGLVRGVSGAGRPTPASKPAIVSNVPGELNKHRKAVLLKDLKVGPAHDLLDYPLTVSPDPAGPPVQTSWSCIGRTTTLLDLAN